MLAKVHLAKKELAMDEDDYRQILFDEAGVCSAADADERGLDAVIQRFKGLGWQAKSKGGSRRATSPMARKARALWISLYHLGEVRNKGERALEAFAARQLKCEKMAWANQREAAKLIEALKAMAERGGWSQTNSAGQPLTVRLLNEGLCQAILAKLKACGEIPEDWTLDIAAFRLCGVETGAFGPMKAEDYSTLASQLGAKLRTAGGAA